MASGPSEAIGGCLQHGADAIVLEMRQTKRQRVDPKRRRDFVHVRFAREVVRGRRQAPIRSLPQR